MVKVVFASLFATALGGACSADDQSALADPAAAGKAGGDCGLGAYNVLTGNFNHDKFNSCFMGKLSISSGCSECYATNGEYGAKNCKAACLLGWCKQGCLDCATASEPKAALESCTGFSSPSASPCLEATGGACSADDQSALADPAAAGKAGGDCGLKAYNVLTGNFNHDKFNSCYMGKLSISSGCSECYATNGEYGAKNCKAACLLGWCKQGCLDCATASEPKAALESCTGFSSPSASPCLEATGGCSADEQTALGDGATVGKAGSDCGLGAYNILTGNFNHDKFNSCFTGKLSISTGCSECYATNGDYAAKNCKAACLLGWCKSGCLDCSTASAPKAALDSCTGFASGSATPCLDVLV